jgi:ABC-type transport system involved in cytochrome c biogenesis permease subunit
VSLLKPSPAPTSGRADQLARWFPWAVLALAGAYLAFQARPPSTKDGDFDVQAAATLPVQDDGRIKPLDSVARVNLMAISSRSEFEDANGKMQPAIRWLLDVMSSDDILDSPAGDYKVFRIENDQVLALFGLDGRPGSYRYSIRELFSSPEKVAAADREFARVSEKDPKKQTIYEQKVAELSRKVRTYQNLQRHVVPEAVPPHGDEKRWSSLAAIDKAIVKPAVASILARLRAELGPKVLRAVQQDAVEELQVSGLDVHTLTQQQRETLAAMLHKRYEDELDREVGRKFEREAIRYAAATRPEEDPAAEAFANVLRTWRSGNAADFNGALRDYRNKSLAGVLSSEQERKVQWETAYNRLAPFYHCAALFLLAFVLGCAAWLGWFMPLNRAATLVCALALVVHSAAMAVRIYLQGRPPVTNLYSSAIFIGWGGIAVCLVLERVYRNGIGIVVGSFLGFATMIVAHHLGMGKDTLEKLEAVLDTNFWLATHVTTVTLGYMATFVAGFLGVLYVLRGVFTRSLDSSANRTLSQMIYGILCFAMLLSFVGTVLGGIWADQSWGRFWGWDPKENGAVLIVIWNALVLHARWAGLVKQRGVAVLAIGGNIMTAWSWFGTNQLGIGLHAYGFDSSLAAGCRYFWLAMLVLIGIGLLPKQYWRSFSEHIVRARAEEAREQPPDKKRPRVVTTTK